MTKTASLLLAGLASLSAVPLARPELALASSAPQQSCRIDDGALVADFSKPVAGPIASVVFAVRRKSEEVLSIIVPLNARLPVSTVRVRPSEALSSPSELTVSCSVLPMFGSDVRDPDRACTSFTPIDSGVRLTVREIELSKDGAYIQVTADNARLGALDLSSLSGHSLFLTLRHGADKQIVSAPLYGPAPYTLELRNGSVPPAPYQMDFSVDDQSPQVTFCI
jgi:hypothetical protein